MVRIKNERGGALIMVLLLVVVFTLLGMGLLTMNISAAKQFTKKEEQVQARNLAEMGVLYYKAEVSEALETYVGPPNGQGTYYTGLCDAVNNVATNPYSTSSIKGGEYELAKGTNLDCTIDESDKIVLNVISTGVAGGTTRVIDAEVTLSSTSGDGVGGLSPDFADNWDENEVINLPECKFPANNEECKLAGDISDKNVEFDNDVYEHGGLNIPGVSTNKSTIIFNKNLIMNGSLNTGTAYNTPGLIGKVKILIKGDLVTKSSINILYNEYPVVVCGQVSYTGVNNIPFDGMFYVKGDVYENGQKVNAYKTILPGMEDYIANSCNSAWVVEPGLNAEYK